MGDGVQHVEEDVKGLRLTKVAADARKSSFDFGVVEGRHVETEAGWSMSSIRHHGGQMAH